MDKLPLALAKIADVVIQLMITCAVVSRTDFSDTKVLGIAGPIGDAVVAVIIWQLISSVVHLAVGKADKLVTYRTAWTVSLLCFIVFTIVCICSVILMGLPFLLLPLVGPALVFGYMAICVAECVCLIRVKNACL